jgi:hypothetical protein
MKEEIRHDKDMEAGKVLDGPPQMRYWRTERYWRTDFNKHHIASSSVEFAKTIEFPQERSQKRIILLALLQLLVSVIQQCLQLR